MLFFLLFVAGKDARLYVFRLRALKRGLEERQLVRGKCDSRENKLEKTKGRKPETQSRQVVLWLFIFSCKVMLVEAHRHKQEFFHIFVLEKR